MVFLTVILFLFSLLIAIRTYCLASDCTECLTKELCVQMPAYCQWEGTTWNGKCVQKVEFDGETRCNASDCTQCLLEELCVKMPQFCRWEGTTLNGNCMQKIKWGTELSCNITDCTKCLLEEMCVQKSGFCQWEGTTYDGNCRQKWNFFLYFCLPIIITSVFFLVLVLVLCCYCHNGGCFKRKNTNMVAFGGAAPSPAAVIQASPSTCPSTSASSSPFRSVSSFPFGSASTLPSGSVSASPSGSVSAPPSGPVSTLPFGSASNPPSGSVSALPSGSVSTPPSGSASTPPSGSASTPPSRSASTPPSGSVSTLPFGSVSALPSKSASTLPSGSVSTPPSGSASTPPSGSVSTLLFGSVSALPSRSASTLPSGSVSTPPSGFASAPPSGSVSTLPFGSVSALPSESASTPPSGSASTLPSGSESTPPSGSVSTPPSGFASTSSSGSASTPPSGSSASSGNGSGGGKVEDISLIQLDSSRRYGSYILKDLLAEGGQGRVYLAEHERTHQTRVLKVMVFSRRGSEKGDNEKAVDAESQIGVEFGKRCKYLVDYEEVNIRSSMCFIVMEFCAGGDLRQDLTARVKQKRPYEKEEIYRFLHQIGTAIQTLHDGGVVHRDVKPENVFFGSNQVLKLGDYGTARFMNDDNKTMTMTGTSGYMAPEILSGERVYGMAVDIYSLGIMTFEMMALQHPFRNQNGILNILSVAEGRANGMTSETISRYSSELVSLVKEMIEVDAIKRPVIGKILSIESVAEHMSK